MSATDFSRIRPIPASAIIASVSWRASIPTMGGVPDRKRRIPSAGRYSGPMAKTSAVPIQPWIGWASRS